MSSDFGAKDSSFVLPIAMIKSLMRLEIILSDMMLMSLFLCMARDMGEFLVVPLYERICVIIEAHSLIGHMIGSVILHCVTVTVSDFLLFFCCSKVIEMQSAKCNLADVFDDVVSFDEGNIPEAELLCCCFVFGTLQYLHDRTAQKWAAVASSPIAHHSFDDLEERMRCKMQTSKAF